MKDWMSVVGGAMREYVVKVSITVWGILLVRSSTVDMDRGSEYVSDSDVSFCIK